MLFADDIVLVYELRDDMNAKLERWQEGGYDDDDGDC